MSDVRVWGRDGGLTILTWEDIMQTHTWKWYHSGTLFVSAFSISERLNEGYRKDNLYIICRKNMTFRNIFCLLYAFLTASVWKNISTINVIWCKPNYDINHSYFIIFSSLFNPIKMPSYMKKYVVSFAYERRRWFLFFVDITTNDNIRDF